MDAAATSSPAVETSRGQAQLFVQHLRPRVTDIDGLGHTNNAVYVQWCQTVAWAHSQALGLSMNDYQRLNRAMVIRSAHYDYVQASFLDEDLQLDTWLEAGESALTMHRHFQLRRTSDSTLVLRAQWDLVCIEVSSGKPKRMPPEFVRAYLPGAT
jgi:acyl-CoA thioester hydrolase